MTYVCMYCQKEEAIHEIIPLEAGGVVLVCENCFNEIFQQAYKINEGETNEVRM